VDLYLSAFETVVNFDDARLGTDVIFTAVGTLRGNMADFLRAVGVGALRAEHGSTSRSRFGVEYGAGEYQIEFQIMPRPEAASSLRMVK
jgi:hypothetical protein